MACPPSPWARGADSQEKNREREREGERGRRGRGVCGGGGARIHTPLTPLSRSRGLGKPVIGSSQGFQSQKPTPSPLPPPLLPLPHTTLKEFPLSPAQLIASLECGNALESNSRLESVLKSIFCKSTRMGDDKSKSLPPGWVESFDPGTKRNFFYEKATRRSTWTRPKPFTAAELAAVKSGGSGGGGGGSSSSSSGGGGGGSTSSNSGSGSSANSEGWKEYWDAGHARAYWYNSKTGQSTWTSPFKSSKKTSGGLSSTEAGLRQMKQQLLAAKRAFQQYCNDERKRIEMEWSALERERKVLEQQREELAQKLNDLGTSLGRQVGLGGYTVVMSFL